jgi:hypothetical protein
MGMTQETAIVQNLQWLSTEEETKEDWQVKSRVGFSINAEQADV